jgi:hypothetical protein
MVLLLQICLTSHISDYEAYAFRDASSVEYLLPKAEAFVEAVESLAKKV